MSSSTPLPPTSEQTLQHYEQNAEAFWEGTRDHDVSENIAALLRHITAKAPFSILDVGCGPGRDLKVFTDMGHQAVGLEGSSAFAAMARRHSGCEVWQQDFLQLDLPANRFDGIFANASLFHVPSAELPKVLTSLKNTLKPGGVLFCSNPRGNNEEGWNRGRYGVYHDLAHWRRYMTQAGFEELEHYYRPPGLPREQQPWLASVWRRPTAEAGAFLNWIQGEETHSARWLSATGHPPPKRLQIADDQMTADTAYRLACEGTGLLWQGDFQNARQLLQAMTRRLERKPRRKAGGASSAPSITAAFHLHRQSQLQRARILGMVLIELDADYNIALRRAPDLGPACLEAYGPGTSRSVVSLRELLGVVGAHEWRKKGVPIPALEDRIQPHYGVFSPVRGEYIDLIAQAPLPTLSLAFDIGTGTGVLAALLAKRGVAHIIATDQDPRALNCARENMARLGFAKQVEVIQADLFPPGRAPLIVCNPPWLPGPANSSLDHAIYDPDSRMLRGFLNGLLEHLDEGGEGWLVLSDFAEHLGLRSRAELLSLIDQAGLKVIDCTEVRPRHPKTMDTSDPLHVARSAELTALWRLGAR